MHGLTEPQKVGETETFHSRRKYCKKICSALSADLYEENKTLVSTTVNVGPCTRPEVYFA